MIGFLLLATVSAVAYCFAFSGHRHDPGSMYPPHILPPRHVKETVKNQPSASILTEFTLRDFLSEPFHLALSPSFFGFYGYFGALACWDEENLGQLKSVAGASAGAMAAIMLAAGIPPRDAADFCSSITLDRYADMPGILSLFRGNKFERLMHDFLLQHNKHDLQRDAVLPVAVSAFDLQSLSGRILTSGSMARAARASATFPGLFQPVYWSNETEEYLLMDGGITDTAGLHGLAYTMGENATNARIVNLSVGDWWLGTPPGPSVVQSVLNQTCVMLSISLLNLPQPGPWAMGNGPMAVEAAQRAMKASMDVPLFRGKENNHYELRIDTSTFIY
jgi:predicted acylesterase/phospholipase RssA